MKGTNAGEFNLFPSGQALEALCAWSDNLKSFQQRIGKYFARSEAKEALYSSFATRGTEKRSTDGRAGRIHSPYLLGRRAIWDEEQMCAERLCSRASG